MRLAFYDRPYYLSRVIWMIGPWTPVNLGGGRGVAAGRGCSKVEMRLSSIGSRSCASASASARGALDVGRVEMKIWRQS